ncbi:hypothetical protein [Nocardiopsis potens]|uniref:hypothetical protein n=1 Tax=Nocardiopsis potens TaxID=1246458 RepID=UPI00034B4BCE|nr:hypothetical protein [Nocardiopsis potens]
MFVLIIAGLLGLVLLVHAAGLGAAIERREKSEVLGVAEALAGGGPSRPGSPVTLRGRLAPGPAGVLEGPASQEACVWWQVAARLRRNGGGMPDLPERAASAEPFRLADEAGEASVLVAAGADGLHGAVTVWRYKEKQYGFSDYPDIPVARRVRARCPALAELLTGRQAPAIDFTEHRLSPGDRAFVTGFLGADAETGERCCAAVPRTSPMRSWSPSGTPPTSPAGYGAGGSPWRPRGPRSPSSVSASWRSACSAR